VYFADDTAGREMLVALRFQFENEIVVLAANEDDSIGVFDSSWNLEVDGNISRNLDETPPWKLAISKPLLWSWRMVNQYDYFDGMQLHFAQDVDDTGVLVQLIVVASEIKVIEIAQNAR
jgi:hypothetical protein